jgi:predicted nucleotidyltransferase
MVTKAIEKQRPVKPKASARKKTAPRSRRTQLTPRQRFARLRRNERAALLDFVACLHERLGDRVQRVILYGSRARGRGDAESDLDVLVVVDKVDEALDHTIDQAAFEVIMRYDNALVSPRVWSFEHFDAYRRDRLLLYRNIARDGIELWTTTAGKPN